MENGVRPLCAVLIAGLALTIGGCSRKKEANEALDLESVRASLKEQVARGELTREEAVVRLAEATKAATLGSGGKDKAEYSAALEALSTELKERVAKGELTEEEAKADWTEALEKAKTKTNPTGATDSVEDTE